MKPTLEPLEARETPSVVTYHGGTVLQNPRVANLFVGSYDPSLDRLADVMTGDYTSYLGVYGITRGSHDGTLQLLTQGALSDAQVRQLLTAEIGAGLLPAPDGKSQAYMVYLDHPVTNGYGTYHWYFDLNGTRVPYGVAYPAGGFGNQGPSHELAEVFTDPFLDGWYAGSPQTGEIADLGHGREFVLDGLYVVQPVGPDGNYITGPTAFTPLAAGAQQQLYNQILQVYALLWQVTDPVTHLVLSWELSFLVWEYQQGM